LAAWLAYGVSSGNVLTLPATDCATTVGLAATNATGLKIRGSGHYSGIKYIGASTTTDIVSLGTVAPTYSAGLDLSNFRIWSATTMTAGSGLHLQRVVRSNMSDITVDGYDGNGKLWNGIWFDRIDRVNLRTFDVRAQTDGIRVNGAVSGSEPNVELFLLQGQINLSGVGVHVGGGFGGLYLDQVGITSNGTGVLIDQGLAATFNREIFLGGTTVIDSSTQDGIQVNDSGSVPTLNLYNWNSSNGRYGLNLIAYNGTVMLGGGRWYGNHNNAIQIGTTGANLKISEAWACDTTIGFCVASSVGPVNVRWSGYIDNQQAATGPNVGPNIALTTASAQYALTVANASNALLPALSGLVTLTHGSNGLTGVYTVGGGVVVAGPLSGGAGGWVAPTITPGAGFSSVAWDSASSLYRVYNNTGASVTYRIVAANARPSP
jgi:hypothetical protein